MPNARKGADLRRDPRFALHSSTVDPVEDSQAQWPGEAKISGRAIAAGPITEGPDGDLFHADIAEVVHTLWVQLQRLCSDQARCRPGRMRSWWCAPWLS
jgi:hypothetical protein